MQQSTSSGPRVRLQQRGGVTGIITTTIEVNAGDLSEGERQELATLARDLPATAGATAGDRSGTAYLLEIEDGERRSFTFNDANMPDAQRRLVRWLKKCPAARRSTS